MAFLACWLAPSQEGAKRGVLHQFWRDSQAKKNQVEPAQPDFAQQFCDWIRSAQIWLNKNIGLSRLSTNLVKKEKSSDWDTFSGEWPISEQLGKVYIFFCLIFFSFFLSFFLPWVPGSSQGKYSPPPTQQDSKKRLIFCSFASKAVPKGGMYVSFIGLRLTKTSLTLINRTRLRTKGQSAGYAQAQIEITSNSFQRRAP